MTPLLVLVAALVALGGAVAVGARIPRLAILGLMLVLVGAPFVADPLPSTPALAARLTGGVLAGYLVWVAVRGVDGTAGASGLRWYGTIAVAAAAFAGGWLAAGTIGGLMAGTASEGPATGAGPALAAGSPVASAALAAAAALAVSGLLPVLVVRDALRLGMGLLLLLTAVALLGPTLGTPDDAATVLLALLVAGTGVAVAAVVRQARASGGDLGLHEPPAREPAVRARPPDDAHPARIGR